MTDTLWYTRCPAPTAAPVAIRLGWLDREFARDGIAVRSLAEAPTHAQRHAHYDQAMPAMFRYGGYVPPLVARSRGTDVKMIGLTWHDRVSGFFVLPESGIRRPEDLRGKRLGVPRRRSDNVDWWRAAVLAGVDWLEPFAGLGRDDVTLVDIDVDRAYFADAVTGSEHGRSMWGARSQLAVQREEVRALYRGEVDAIYSDAALAAILQATTGAVPVVSFRGNIDNAEHGCGFPCVLTVSGGLLRERPDLVDRWVACLMRAQDWVSAHEAEARTIMARDAGLPEDLLEAAYSPRVLSQVDVNMDPVQIALLRGRYEHLLRHGFLGDGFDFEDFLDDGPVRRAQALLAAAA